MALHRELSHSVDFALVYLEEAHPTDGWLYGSVTHFLPQPTTLAERCHAATLLATELRKLDAPSMPLCVDTMPNRASYAFGALPERLVIVQSGVVQFIGGKGPEQYSIAEARDALQRLL